MSIMTYLFLHYRTFDGSDLEELPSDVFTHIGQIPLVYVLLSCVCLLCYERVLYDLQ